MHSVVYTIEFQKRGLPHAHILLWLDKSNNDKTTEFIDSIISAEIPDKIENIAAYDLVTQFMMHGPCGKANTKAACMDKDKTSCTKKFPKSFQTETAFDENGYAIYRRRDDGR